MFRESLVLYFQHFSGIFKTAAYFRSSDIDHKMLDLSVIKSSDDKKNCPRCGGQVSTVNVTYRLVTNFCNKLFSLSSVFSQYSS